MTLRDDVVALYVDPRGPYPKLVREWYDEKRDAKTYAGPLPVVAHPPCGPWANLRHLHRSGGEDCALRAVRQVRFFGGVLEHPAHSKLWLQIFPPQDTATTPYYSHGSEALPRPGRSPHERDSYGGFTVEVEQVSWGHVARKRTWLYCVGVDRDLVARTMLTGGTPTHWTSGGRTPSSRRGSPVPPGIKVCSAQQRRRTPEAFARWLLDLAATARVPQRRTA